MKTYKNLLALFSIVLLALCCKKEKLPTASVSGTVFDSKNNPIEAARVTIEGSNENPAPQTTTTKGEYNFTYVNRGNNYKIKVEKSGYITVNDKLEVGDSPISGLNFYLKKVIEITPEAGLDFGANERIKKFDIKNNSDKPIGFTIKVNNTWITLEPSTGTIPPNSILPISVTVDDKGKLPAKHDGSLTLNFDSNVEARNYSITMFVPNNDAPSVICGKPTNITRTSAQVSGIITNVGKGPVTRHGHVWSENPNPTCCVPGFFTDFGARGTGEFVSSIGPLVSGKKYYVKAYAFNGNGSNPSVEEFEFTTSVTITPPDITINSISSITTNSAKVVAKINNDGGATINKYGVVWTKKSISNTPDPRVHTTKKEFTGSPSTTEVTFNLDGLDAGMEYYISAYAYNVTSTDPGVSKAISFNTSEPVTEPKLTTSAAIDIKNTSAVMRGSITELGSIKIVEHGFVYSKSNANPTINGKNCTYKNWGTVSMNSQLPFVISRNTDGLLKGMNYYYKTYTKTENGEYYYSAVTRSFATSEENLVYYWTFDSDFKDKSGNANDGEGSAKLVSDRFDNPENAIDVSSGNVREIPKSKLNVSNDLTISMQLKLDESNFNGSKKVIYGHTNGTCSLNGFMLFFDPNRQGGKNGIFLQVRNEVPVVKKVLDKNDLIKSWLQLVITKAGTRWSLFINGENISNELFDVTNFSEIIWNGNKSYVGIPWSFCDSEFGNLIAQIDDVRRYNKAFSEAEVLELYNREK